MKLIITVKQSFCFYKNSPFHISSFSNMIVVSTVCFAFVSDSVILIYKILMNFSVFQNTPIFYHWFKAWVSPL